MLIRALLLIAMAQAPAPAQDPDADQGIAIDNEVVKQRCGGCHAADDKGRMSRISFRRTTPEGWQQTIKRMVALNGVKLTPEEARVIVKYLANRLGLAPEEARGAQFEVERRVIDFQYKASPETEATCNRCHSVGRVLPQRRTKQEWGLLIAMHRGYYPLSDFQAFRRTGPPQREPGPDGRPPDNRHPMEKAIEHLSGAFPLKTAEWTGWSAAAGAARVEGRWALSGYETGKGWAFGQMTVRRDREEDEFVTEVEFRYARSGEQVTRAGRAIVYTGFQWRGRSGTGDGQFREVMLVERNRREMSGRWFQGAYDERGMDVKLVRLGSDALVSGVHPEALKAGSGAVEVTVYGANLGAGDVDLGPGVKVNRVVRATPSQVTVEVSVDAKAAIGRRDVAVGGAVKERALAVFDKVDAIKVRPQAGLARIGGVRFPKGYQQFEAVGVHYGADAKPDTADDVDLGLMPVAWSIEEYTATFGDDDKQFVGSLDANGLFTPAVDGPNPKRRNNTNNMGDVWVVATYEGDKKLRARAHLLVSPPVYMRFDQPEVGQ